MVRHLNTIAALHAAWATMQLLIALAIGALFALVGGGMGMAGMGGGEEELVIFGVVYGLGGLVAAVVALVMCIPGFLAAYGLYHRKGWSRILGLIVSALALMNFPLGTMLGVYSLMVLLDADVAAELAAGS